MSGRPVDYRVMVGVALVAVWGPGCETRAKGPRKIAVDGSTPVASATDDYETFVFDGDLPEVNSTLPPLDGGRIVVPTPKGWRIPARSAKYTAVFALSKEKTYPRIVVIADSEFPTDDLTPSNVAEQAEKKAAALGVSVDAAKLGSQPALHYTSSGQSDSGAEIDLETFETYLRQRRYAVELQTLPGAAEHKHRAALVAVARRVKFPTPEEIAESKKVMTPSKAKPAGTGSGQPSKGGKPPAKDAKPTGANDSVNKDSKPTPADEPRADKEKLKK